MPLRPFLRTPLALNRGQDFFVGKKVRWRNGAAATAATAVHLRNEAKVSVKEEEEIDGLPLSLPLFIHPSRAFRLNGRKNFQCFLQVSARKDRTREGERAGMIDAERRGNRRCANKRQDRGTEGGRERPTKTECGRQTKEGREGRFDGSAGKSLKRENKRGLDWTAREERMEGECWGV